MQPTAQRGFTLIETMIAAGIFTMLAGVLVVMASRTVAASDGLALRMNAAAGVGSLVERLTSDAASAFAVYVPATDALGDPNADGHEIDFYAQDGSHRPSTWAYRFDPVANTVTRYATGNGTPAAGTSAANIDSFVATAARASDLSNAASPAYDPLFGGAHAPDVPFSFAAMPAAIGGNRLVELTIAARGIKQRVWLAAADAPTAFTVVVTYTPSPAPVVTPTPVPLVMSTP